MEGNTDSHQISTCRYPCNWELSAARASSLIRYLLSNTAELSPERIIALAYGKTKQVALNDSEQNWRKNRRGEIVSLNPVIDS
ncbi:OmpA family protein [Halobacillus mangrovi]|uniref:OmpA family protein n=1 Tax=Halobacillus mangrovi TaxID=402384 RepID=UPI003D986121